MAKKKVREWLPEQPCKVCGRPVPIPMEYCSSICWRQDKYGRTEEDDSN